MKFHKSIIRLVSRKDKKALKNYPCKKTKRGRYIIDVLSSYYDFGSIGIGYFNGYEIFQHEKGFEHPKGYFYHNLINGSTPWKYNEAKYPQENITINEDLFEFLMK